MAVLQWSVLAFVVAIFSADPASKIVAKVNGTAITSDDLQFAATQQGIGDDVQARTLLIKQLIDRQLIRSFLATQKIEPVPDDVQHQIARAEELIRKRGEDPKTLLPKIGYTPERLKSELELPLAWQVYARKTVTAEQIKQYFEMHKQEIDGTQLRARQIFLKLPPSPTPAQSTLAQRKLADIRRDIQSKSITFADAAKLHSEAPTREKGGDLGLFGCAANCQLLCPRRHFH